jgi:hypothetical protein
MEDTEYEAYLKKQTYDDLLSIRTSINRVAQPARFALVNAEIETRDRIPAPSPLAGKNPDPMLRPHTQPEEVSSLTKALVIIGFLIQVACAFMRYAEGEDVQTVRVLLALGGGVLSAVGTARFAKTLGYSRWLGVLGLFGILGIGLLCALPRRQPRQC